jgi:site-specific DNA-methyltransferase (cytosine-N4-specific)
MTEAVIIGDATLHMGDCLAVMSTLPAGSVDLVFGSPPYEAARTYGIGFNLQGQAWVDWMVAVTRASLRVCKGLVAFVVEGRTRDFAWSGTPALLMADLLRAGITLRKPPAFHRGGIPGSGGPDWLRNDYEFILCATNGGKLPWSDNTACGHPPKYLSGGGCCNRRADGNRVGDAHRDAFGFGGRRVRTRAGTRAFHLKGDECEVSGRPISETKVQTRRKSNGVRARDGLYAHPAIANPGNVIDCGAAGGGNMGSRLCHENEAPFPEALAEFFVKSFCPAGGVVLDPLCGSGTTLAVALKYNRRAIGIDIRQGQIELTTRRLKEDSAPATHVSEQEREAPLFAGQESDHD